MQHKQFSFLTPNEWREKMLREGFNRRSFKGQNGEDIISWVDKQMHDRISPASQEHLISDDEMTFECYEAMKNAI